MASLLQGDTPWDKRDAVVILPDGTRLDLSGRLTGARLTSSFAEGSTLELDVHDPDRSLRRSEPFSNRTLARRITLFTGDVEWRLGDQTKTDEGVTLCFYDAAIADAKHLHLPHALKASRGSSTRAEFLHRLFTAGGIPFHALAEHEKQPIAQLSKADRESLAKAQKSAAAFAGTHSKFIQVIGDSLGVGTKDLMPPLLSDFTVHQTVLGAQRLAWGVAQLTAMGGFAQTLVVQLGTNDENVSNFENGIAQLMALAGEHRRVIWVNIKRPRIIASLDFNTDEAPLNAALRAAAEDHSNLEIVDWKGAVERQHIHLDPVHPDARGYRIRAHLIADAIKGGA